MSGYLGRWRIPVAETTKSNSACSPPARVTDQQPSAQSIEATSASYRMWVSTPVSRATFAR